VPALLEQNDGARFVWTPAQPAEENRVTSRTTVRVAAGADAAIESRAFVHGEPARLARNRIADVGTERPADAAISGCRGLHGGRSSRVPWSFDRLEAVYEPLVFEVSGAWSTESREAPVVLPFACVPAITPPLPALDERETPFAHPYTLRDTVLVEAPDGYAVSRVPPDAAVSSDAISFSATYRVSGSKVLAIREVKILATRIDPGDDASRRVLGAAGEGAMREIVLERR
jgi:hypothetical protein